MKISRADLQRLAPTDLHEGVVLNRLHYYFCRPMTVRGLCSRVCDNCKPDLNRIVNNGKGRPEANDRVALVVYMARTVMAEKAERPPGEMERDFAGDVIEGNPFDMFMEELDG